MVKLIREIEPLPPPVEPALALQEIFKVPVSVVVYLIVPLLFCSLDVPP